MSNDLKPVFDFNKLDITLQINAEMGGLLYDVLENYFEQHKEPTKEIQTLYAFMRTLGNQVDFLTTDYARQFRADRFKSINNPGKTTDSENDENDENDSEFEHKFVDDE